MSRDPSVRYKKKKENILKSLCERHHNLTEEEEEKRKSKNMVCEQYKNLSRRKTKN